MKKPRKFIRRSFLNQKGYHQLGAVLATVECTETTYGDGEVRRDVDAHLTISDCGRQITLDFDVWGKGASSDIIGSQGNAVAKMNRLIATLTAMRDHLYDCYDWQIELDQ